MSSSSSSAVESSSGRSWKNWEAAAGTSCKKSNWSCMNITGMVLGFILFWPIGLFILFWILSGRNVQELPATIKRKWSEKFGGDKMTVMNDSDNSVFNAFQQTQYDRISEIKDEIRERSRRFTAYRADAKRRADEEEFNQFMASSPASDNK